jgi:uncharacterized integral membrane protein
MTRKIVTALILVPLTILFVSFAVANRQTIVVSLDPFDQVHPALAVAMPLFALILALLIGGVVIGGAAAWLRQAKWRRAARIADGEARALRAEVDRLRRRIGPAELAAGPPASGMTAPLSIPPPQP